MPITTKVRSAQYGPGIAEVNTASGRVRGMIRNDVYTFLGMKYADAERFEMPKPPAPWTGVKEALLRGPVCPAFNGDKLPAGNIQGVWPEPWPAEEACQTINVWSTGLGPDKKKPVMFWVHGGGGAFGSAIDFDGEALAAYGDVVAVSHHHRLNCLGLLDLSDYGEEFRQSCDLEYFDIIAALKWVKENIAQFGGDPNNVTLMGHSGGGGKILGLFQRPAADGLYHKAIIMAGVFRSVLPPLPTRISDKECARRIAAKTLEKLSIPASEARKLKTVPYNDLCVASLAAMREVCLANDRMPTWGQTVSEFYPGSWFQVGLRPEIKDIPIFVGSAIGERNCNLERWSKDPLLQGNKNTWDAEHCEKALRLWFGDKYDQVVEEYPKAYPNKKLVDALFTDMGHRASIMEFAEAKYAQGGAPVYMYLFAREMPLNGGMVAWHGTEIDFAFHYAEYSPARWLPDGDTARMQDEMCACWTSFARTGNPNNPLVPYLPATTPEEYATIVWDTDTTVRINHDRKLAAILPRLDIPRDPASFTNG